MFNHRKVIPVLCVIFWKIKFTPRKGFNSEVESSRFCADLPSLAMGNDTDTLKFPL